MNFSSWYNIKEKVYYLDDFGRLRDIYVLNTTKEDWNNWIDLINEKYPVEFFDGRSDAKTALINKTAVFEKMQGKSEFGCSAEFKVGETILRCLFFHFSDIENDIDPEKINTPEDHEGLMNYLKEVSIKLGKRVVLTLESEPNLPLITVENDIVSIPFE